jgi:4-amino-4-deoxy-L-arabinose transferase-like glycosyltransferase
MIVKFILFSASFALVSISALKQLKMLRLTNNIEKVLAFMLLASGNIVLCTYILSEFSFISVPGYLMIQTFFALASWGLQFKFRKHFKPAGIEIKNDEQPSPGVDYFPKWLLIGLLSVILLTALINLFLSVYVPPNNSDSMTYHLSRVGYWLQQGSLHHYYTHKWTQNTLPPNAEIIILWSITFLKSDILANMVQWIAYCGIGLAIYLIARLLGHGQRTSVFASLIYLSLPMVVLQSSTTQNDLVVTFFAVSFFYFFHIGLKQRNYRKLLLSGIALGLAVGTKYTILYMLPALGIASLILLRKYKTKVSLYVHWCVFCLVGILVFGAYNYIQNYQTYGNPIGPPKEIYRFSGKKNIEKAFLNALRFGYEACDFRGLPEPLESYLFNLKESFGKRYLTNKNIVNKYVLTPVKASFSFKSNRYYQESSGWFGVIGFFLYFPAAAWFFFRIFWKLKSAIDERWIYAFIAVFFFIFTCFMQNYYPWFGRYFVLPAAFIAPIAVAFTKIKNRTLIIIAALCISLVGAVTSVNISLNNRKKPLLPVQLKKGGVHVLNANFYRRRAGVVSPRIVPFLQFIEQVTIPGTRIGHICRVGDWDYIFFGRDFSRSVIPIKRPELKRGETRVMEKNELDFLIISIDKSEALTSPDLVLPTNKRKRFFRIISRHNWQVPIPYCSIKIPLLKLWKYKTILKYSKGKKKKNKRNTPFLKKISKNSRLLDICNPGDIYAN